MIIENHYNYQEHLWTKYKRYLVYKTGLEYVHLGNENQVSLINKK